METQRNDQKSSTLKKGDANRDAVACAPCAPSTDVAETRGRAKGAAIGGAVGRAIGTGADVVVATVAGGITAGKNAAKCVDPSTEHEFWRKEYENRPYFTNGTHYDQYGPAFQYGWESHASHKGKAFTDVEPQLGRDWESRRGKSKLSWNNAKGATHDAWQRAEKAVSGDSCGAN